MAPGVYEADNPVAQAVVRFGDHKETSADPRILADGFVQYARAAERAGITDPREQRAGFLRAIRPYLKFGDNNAGNQIIRAWAEGQRQREAELKTPVSIQGQRDGNRR